MAVINDNRDSLIRFDTFELDTKRLQLRRGGLPVDLPPQAFRILALLAARPNGLVTRAEIKQTLWPDESHGDFDSRLNFAIKKLREALRDSAEHPRYIQTERKAGYVFIAPVRGEQDSQSAPLRHVGPLPVRAPGPSGVDSFRLGRSSLLMALIAVVSIAAIASAVLRRTTDPPAMQNSLASTDDSKPEISFVNPILPQARQKILIQGRGLGMHVPYARTDSPYLAIRDNTTHWAAGRMVPHNWDEVTLDVDQWNDTEILITGFSGDYGKKGWELHDGDDLEIAVWNPQTGAGPALYHTTVASAQE